MGLNGGGGVSADAAVRSYFALSTSWEMEKQLMTEIVNERGGQSNL